MKQLPKKTAMLLLTGLLLAQTTCYADNTPGNPIVCSAEDDCHAVSPCTAFGDSSELMLIS